jgi:pyrrolysyl-tRNA synthetase-like protein
VTENIKEKYYRKQTGFFLLLDKIKLWPSRKGLLHGIKDFEIKGPVAELTTHCNRTFRVRESRNSRAARWLRNKWYKSPCKKCQVPDWKIEKYSKTYFDQHRGSTLGGKV